MSSVADDAGDPPPLSSYHPFDPALQADPFAYYARCRREAPVLRDESTGIFLVSSYEAVLETVKRWDAFSTELTMGGLGRPATAGKDARHDGDTETGWPFVNTLVTSDPPDRTRFRSLVTRAFHLKRVESLVPRTRKLCDDLIDRFAGKGRVELRAEFAVPLPLTLIAEQLGIPAHDLPLCRKWSEALLLQLSGMATHEQLRGVRRSALEFQRYFAHLLTDRATHPRDDIISDLVAARAEDGMGLDTAEHLSLIQQLLVAGNEMTAATLLEGMLLFVRNPDQGDKLRARPELLDNAIEEILRLTSPTASMWRRCTQETTLAGVRVPEGAICLLRFASANRDEAVFEEPERFDVERRNARDHLAFGFGVHFCIGAELARTQLREGFRALLDRLPDARLAHDAEPLEHRPSILHWGLRALPLEFTTSAR